MLFFRCPNEDTSDVEADIDTLKANEDCLDYYIEVMSMFNSLIFSMYIGILVFGT